MQETTTDRWIIAIIVTAFVALNLWRFGGTVSPDMLATWMAGHMFWTGQADQIYRVDAAFYTILPPDSWWPVLDTLGDGLDGYPFVYPPLWAALLSPLTAIAGIGAFQWVMCAVNPLLIAGMVWLALRAGQTANKPLGLLIGLFFIGYSLIGDIALQQNQPQIAVSFLLVAMVERLAKGDERSAGLCLALAAAVKIYPVFFALLLLTGGHRRAFLWFAAASAALAALSLLVAGVDMHIAFLRQIGVMDRTVIVSPIIYSLNTFLAQIMAHDAITYIDYPPAVSGREVGVAGWAAVVMPLVWQIASKAALLAFLAGGTLALRRQSARPALVWAALFTLYGLIGPLSWSHHFLTAAAFAPLVALDRRIDGITPLAIAFALVSLPLALPISGLWSGYLANQFAGTFGMVSLATAFVLALRSRKVHFLPAAA